MVSPQSRNRILVRTEQMDGSRGLLSVAAGSTAAPQSSQKDVTPRNTRSRPVSADTRLRQKPAHAAAQQDFFASLGIDNSLRSRSSNRSKSYTNIRPGSSAGLDSSVTSNWVPPPIGGLGSQRSPPRPLQPTVGSLSVTGAKTSATMLRTSNSTSKRSIEGSGLKGASAVVPASSTATFSAKSSATAVQSNAMQLFSMEDAEELYSDDGWNCDSPSTVLSCSMEDSATKAMTAAPVLVAAVPVVKTPADDFGWGDDDDVIASPVVRTIVPTLHPPLFEKSSVTITGVPATITTETNEETCSPSQSLSNQTASFSFNESSSDDIKIRSADTAQMSSQIMTREHVHPPPPPNEASLSGLKTLDTKSGCLMQESSVETKSALERPHVQAASSGPQGATPLSFLSTDLEHKTSFTVNEAPTYMASPAFTFTESRQNKGEWDQYELPAGEDVNAMKTTKSPAMNVAMATTATQLDSFVVPPVELASPGGAAGDFWGGSDEDELFDPDDNANEEWDETIKDRPSPILTEESRLFASSDHEASYTLSSQPSPPDFAPTALSGNFAYSDREAINLLPSQPVPLHSVPAAESVLEQEAVVKETEVADNVSGPTSRKETKEFCRESLIATTTQAPVAASSVIPLTATRQEPNAEGDIEAKTVALLRTKGLPDPSAVAEPESRGSNTNVFPEAPRTARFLHTPTGTGGPFGRVPSPHSDDNFNFQDEMSGDSTPTAHIDQQRPHTPMTFSDDKKPEAYNSYSDFNVRWDADSSPHGGLGQNSAEELTDPRDGDLHQTSREGQSDEEERDSVVSFSGEHSFFPSAGRPSSLYGGSQSSFASHRMYPSSVASTDHDGSSIASFGVSSTGATVGGSERVSEGGAFSDGTLSETPSIVGSSNASTAFGTDFVSVSEGQFSAPGTTIGGSDNASDGGFSDGNASETGSLCESVTTRSPFVSEYSASSDHYITKTVEHHDLQEPSESAAPVSGAVPIFGESATAASSLFENVDATANETPFSSSPSLFPSQHTTNALPAVMPPDSAFASESTTQKETFQSAASLFGATVGADVSNPFCSFDASSATALKSKPAHELPISNAENLFGAGPLVSDFNGSCAQPVNLPLSSSYQIHGQSLSQAERSPASVFVSSHDRLASSSSHDRLGAVDSALSPFESYSSHNYNKPDPFTPRGGSPNDVGNSVLTAYSSGEVTDGNTGVDLSASSHFGGDAQTSADAVFRGCPRLDYRFSKAASHFEQPIASRMGNQDYTYAQETAVSYTGQNPTGALSSSEKGTHAQLKGSTLGGDYGQTQNIGVKAAGHSRQPSTSSSARRDMSEFGQQSRGSDRTPSSKAPNVHQSLHFGRTSTPIAPGSYSHQSMAGSASVVNQGSWNSNHSRYDQNVSREAENHLQSSSGATTDAVFGRSSALTAMAAPPTMSDIHGPRIITDSANDFQQPSAQSHTQRSSTQVASCTSSNPNQHGTYVPTVLTAMHPVAQSHGSITPYDSVNNAGFSRNASSCSLNQFDSDASSEHRNLVQQSRKNTPARTFVSASSFFGKASSATATVTASAFFSGAASPGLSEKKMLQHDEPNYFSTSYVQTTQESVLFPQKEQEEQTRHHKFGSEHVEKGSPLPLAQDLGATAMTTLGHMGQRESLFGDANLSSTGCDMQQEAEDQYDMQPQAFDGFADSKSQGFGGQHSSDFVSSSSTPQAHNATLSYHSDQKGYRQFHEQELTQVYEAAAATLPLAQTYSANTHTGGSAFNGGSSVHAPAACPEKYLNTGANEAPNFANQLHHQTPQHAHYEQHQRQFQHHASTKYGNFDSLKQPQALSANTHASSLHEYRSADNCGQKLVSEPQVSHSRSLPVVMTSNKYKDPCVAPPSCLASFGFGGNVVTMFPKRKLRLNIAGSSFRNSPRGASPPSDFENSGTGELRKGPVNLFRMEQLHQNDNDFMQMDIFPGPLTESISDEAILEYIDDRLKCSDSSESAAEVMDENVRLLLGVLRVLVKCNGKLRSESGTLKPNDPDSPEAQLISLLSEGSKRRSKNNGQTFSEPRSAQFALQPDLALKHVNQLRELLLVGDRKNAVSTAISAHMWPEAMLIASFTDKEEYRRVLRTYLEETYAIGDPSRTLFMSFADQQEKSVQEPKRLLQTNAQKPTESLVLSMWVSHAQVLIANRTADTNKILIELGDRLWNEANMVAAAHVCYLLAGIQVEAPITTSKIALLGGDHRTPTEARFYVSPSAVQLTEIYEWVHKYSKGPSPNLMIPYQGYKLIYAMLLADHGKLETSFKYVTSMLRVIKAVTATMKPGTSMNLEGIKNQLTVLDDRLRQHLGQDRVASVAASTSRSEGNRQGKWGIGSALSIMGKIVNRVVEGNDSSPTTISTSSTNPLGGLYANEATPSAAIYPSSSTLPSMHLHMQQHAQQHAQQSPSPQVQTTFTQATPPISQGSAPGSSNGYSRIATAPSTAFNSRPGGGGIPPSGLLSGLNQEQSFGPFSGNGRPGSAGHLSNNGPRPLLRSQHSTEPPGSNRSTHSNRSGSEMSPAVTTNVPQYQFQHAPPTQQQQPPLSQTSQHSQSSQNSHTARQKAAPLDLSGDVEFSSQPKSLSTKVAASLQPPDAATMSGPSSDKGRGSPRLKKITRSKTPPPSGSSKGSGWLSGLSSFIATKMNPEAKVAKLGEQMEAYFDEEKKCWVFPGETSAEEPAMPSAPPTGPMPGSAPGSSAAGIPPMGTSSAPGSISSDLAPSNDPLAALMAPPPSHRLMKKDPLAAMMAPPSRPGLYGARGSTPQRKPPRPQFAVFKPSVASTTTSQE